MKQRINSNRTEKKVNTVRPTVSGVAASSSTWPRRTRTRKRVDSDLDWRSSSSNEMKRHKDQAACSDGSVKVLSTDSTVNLKCETESTVSSVPSRFRPTLSVYEVLPSSTVSHLEKITDCKIKYHLNEVNATMSGSLTEDGRRVNFGRVLLRAHIERARAERLAPDFVLPLVGDHFDSKYEYVCCWDFTRPEILLSRFDIDLDGQMLTYDGNRRVLFAEICGENGYQLVERVDDTEPYALFRRGSGASYFGPLGMARSFYSEIVARLCARAFKGDEARRDIVEFLQRCVTIQEARVQFRCQQTWVTYWLLNISVILNEVLAMIKTLPLARRPGFFMKFIYLPFEEWVREHHPISDASFDEVAEAQLGRATGSAPCHPSYEQRLVENKFIQPIVHANGGDRQLDYADAVEALPKKPECRMVRFVPHEQPKPEMVFQIAPGIPAQVCYHLNSPMNLYSAVMGRQMKFNEMEFEEKQWERCFNLYLNDFIELNFPANVEFATLDPNYGNNGRWSATQRMSLENGKAMMKKRPFKSGSRKGFVKREVLNKSLDKYPRMITTYPDTYKAKYNPLINGMKLYMKEYVCKHHERVGQTFVYTDGMSVDVLGHTIYEAVGRVAQPAFIEVDYSEFDSSQRAQHFEVLRAVYKHICSVDCHKVIDDYIDDIGGVWKYRVGGKFANAELEAVVKATRGSGAGDTSLGNSILNAFFVYCWQRESAAVAQQFCLGDDSLIIGDELNLKKMVDASPFFASIGIKAKIKYSEELSHVEYLSRWFVPAEVHCKHLGVEGDKMIPTYAALRKLGRVIGLSTKKVINGGAETAVYWVKLAQMYKSLMNDTSYITKLSNTYKDYFNDAQLHAMKILKGNEHSYERIISHNLGKEHLHKTDMNAVLDNYVLREAFMKRYKFSTGDFEDMMSGHYIPKGYDVWFTKQYWMELVSEVDLDNSGTVYTDAFTDQYQHVYKQWFGSDNCVDTKLGHNVISEQRVVTRQGRKKKSVHLTQDLIDWHAGAAIKSHKPIG